MSQSNFGQTIGPLTVSYEGGAAAITTPVPSNADSTKETNLVVSAGNKTAGMGNAGDLTLQGGNAAGSTGNGGNVILTPGTSASGSPGTIIMNGVSKIVSGSLLVNTTAPILAGDVATLANTSTSPSANLVLLYVANLAAGAAQLQLLKAQGTFASPTAVSSTDALATISVGGYDSSVWKNTFNIVTSATENWNSSHHGTNVIFNAVPTGSNSPTARITLGGDGNVLVTPKLLTIAGLGVGNSAAATTVTHSAVVKKMEVFDATGVSLGFIAIYNSIS